MLKTRILECIPIAVVLCMFSVLLRISLLNTTGINYPIVGSNHFPAVNWKMFASCC